MLPNYIGVSCDKRAELIADYLLDNNSDIFVFQEAFDANARAIIYSKLQSTYPYYIEPQKQKKFSLKINSGLWILSKYPIIESDFHRFRSCCGYDALAQKGILYVKISVDGHMIQVFNTHLNSGQDRQVIRDSQYREIKKFIDGYKNKKDMQIIAGDFNTNKSDKISYNKMLFCIGLSDYLFNELTYDADNNDLNDEYLKDIIDYIFIKNTFKSIIETRKVNRPTKRWSDTHKDLSDHYPVVLSLAF